MPLRCLLFSSNEEMVQPIWQVLTDLGIEGEYCRNAVDAVERVTTQLFQIVITDWEDQPEATFLLKTARDQRAAQRPLTLAMVNENARPEALQAGANSVLLKPIRVEQVRDTLSTACELLRAKMPASAPPPAETSSAPQVPADGAMAASAAAASASPPASSSPASVSQAPEKAFRAGEFLQSGTTAPGTQFDTECDVQKSLDQAAAAEVDALTELEPMASAVVESPAAEPADPQAALTGWASLQERLTRSAPPPPADASPKSELLSYGETPSFGGPSASPPEDKNPPTEQEQREASHEAALFAYIAGETKEETEPVHQANPRLAKLILVSLLAAVCVGVVAVPRTRQGLRIVYRSAVRAGGSWLNPPPAPVPQAAPQHESFGAAGDEYKLPVAANIPDATTDPSQIRVLPVIDPTAKPVKPNDSNSAQAVAGENGNTPGDQAPAAPAESGQVQAVESPVAGQTASTETAAAGATVAAPSSIVPPVQSPPNSAPVLPATPQPTVHISPPPAPISASSHPVPAGNNSAIPSSLRSQIASMTPEASGAKSVEAAMSSIEPVNLPESAAWDLLAQKVDPEYPEAAKPGKQVGSVVLQVFVGRDGTVQDAKFLQGSLVFAKAAIDAVRQWHFKPYSLNGRAVSVQSSITLNFKPPA
ncbi:MAG TPA: TonB family protein [Candidatus Sulfotelmatobacter sp.]|nr:TonB family protein [Candidatus Sulfotelmatobacter sp.]